MPTALQVRIFLVVILGLWAFVFQRGTCPGFSLQVLATRTSWLRAFRFNPAAIQLQECYRAAHMIGCGYQAYNW
ncbi:hypothetical protein [Foetidibacter luteolus]|uniref:hypothetical protein n=1 Tax=Foetidibacter luteolus TaxID=2608880 RepID=UPI00129B7670|nr:hypothetical protein [Foetidibacter luteolus]